MIKYVGKPRETPDEAAVNDPTPEEIEIRAAEVRRRWSASQRERRRVTAIKSWRPPMVYLDDMSADANQSLQN